MKTLFALSADTWGVSYGGRQPSRMSVEADLNTGQNPNDGGIRGSRLTYVYLMNKSAAAIYDGL